MNNKEEDIYEKIKCIAEKPEKQDTLKAIESTGLIKKCSWHTLKKYFDQLEQLIYSKIEDGKLDWIETLSALMCKKYFYEYIDLKTSDRLSFINSIIGSIIVLNTRLRPEFKAEVMEYIIDAFTINEQECCQLCKSVFEIPDLILSQELKVQVAQSIGLNSIESGTNLVDLINSISALNIKRDSSGEMKHKLNMELWKSTPNDRDKISQLYNTFRTMSSNKYVDDYMMGDLLEGLIETFDSELIVDNIDLIISQINLIKHFHMSAAICAFTRLYLSIENNQNNKGVFEKLLNEIQLIQGEIEEVNRELLDEKDKHNDEEVSSSSVEALEDISRFDCTDVDSLMSSIVHRKLSDGEIIYLWEDLSEIQQANIIKSLLLIMEKDDGTSLEEGDISTFIELCKHDYVIVGKTDQQALCRGFEDLCNRYDNTNRLDDYTNDIRESGTVDDIDEFEKQVKKFRCKGDRLPKIVYDFIIKGAIDEKIDKIKYKRLIQGAIIDFSLNLLESIGQLDYLVCFNGSVYPYYGFTLFQYGIIFYSYDFFETNIEQYLHAKHLLLGPIHEPRHVWQEVARKRGLLKKSIYKMSEENLIQKQNMFFYDDHYMEMEEEFDARLYSAIALNKYLLELGYSPEFIAKSLNEDLENEILMDKKHNRGIKSNMMGNKMVMKDLVKDAFSKDTSLRNVSKLFDDNPLLSLEYKIVSLPDSICECRVERRSSEEIEHFHQALLSMMQNESDRQSVDELFDYIISGEKEVKHDEMTNGEYIKYMGYDKNQGLDSFSKISPCLEDYPIFDSQAHNSNFKKNNEDELTHQE